MLVELIILSMYMYLATKTETPEARGLLAVPNVTQTSEHLKSLGNKAFLANHKLLALTKLTKKVS